MNPWEYLLRRYGEADQKTPVELIGSAVYNRIVKVRDPWATRQIIWPVLGTLGLLAAGMGISSISSGASFLYPTFWGGISTLLLFGAHRVNADHFNITLEELHGLAKTKNKQLWINRIENLCVSLKNGTIPAMISDGHMSHVGKPFAENCPKEFEGNDARIFVINSSSGKYDGLPKRLHDLVIDIPDSAIEHIEDLGGPPTEAPIASKESRVEPVAVANHPKPVPDQLNTSELAAHKPDKISERHFLHGVDRGPFRKALRSWLKSEKSDKDRKSEIEAMFCATHDLVKNDPYPSRKSLIGNVRKRMQENYGKTIALDDGSIGKMIGASQTHSYGKFRAYIMALDIQKPMIVPPQQSLF